MQRVQVRSEIERVGYYNFLQRVAERDFAHGVERHPADSGPFAQGNNTGRRFEHRRYLIYQ